MPKEKEKERTKNNMYEKSCSERVMDAYNYNMCEVSIIYLYEQRRNKDEISQLTS